MRTVYPRGRGLATIVALGLLLAACGGEKANRAAPEGKPPASTSPDAEPPAGAPPEAATANASPANPAPETRAPEAPLVVFLGDSLTAGYGLAEDEAFPARVGERLRERGLPARVVNAGVSGDTSAGGLARLDWVLKQRPDVLVVGLGGNDALRGQPLESVEENLRMIVAGGREAGARVLLLGQRIPTNYGPDYAEGFAALYPRVAREAGATLMPFLLDGVGGRPALNLPDGIHPNARGHAIVADNVAPYVERLVREAARE